MPSDNAKSWFRCSAFQCRASFSRMLGVVALAILPLSVNAVGGNLDPIRVVGKQLPIERAGHVNAPSRPHVSETLFAEAPAEVPEPPVIGYPSKQNRKPDDLEPATDKVDDPIPLPKQTREQQDNELNAGEKSLEGYVARAQFTRDVIEREPVDKVESPVLVSSGESINLFYFTDIREMPGETVSHHWFYEHKPISAKTFEVGGNRWRVFSSNRLQDTMPGRWEVQVKDSRGEIIKVDSFVVDASKEQSTDSDRPLDGSE